MKNNSKKVHYGKILLYVSVFTFCLKVLSQNNGKLEVSATKALELSEDYSQKASWFTNMPQYNRDSTVFYAEKAIAMLKNDELLHQNKLRLIRLKKLKSENRAYSLSEQDSITGIAWNNVKKLNRDKKENRTLLFEYLAYWSDIKMSQGQRETSLDLFTQAISLLQYEKGPEIKAKINLHKGLFYARYGLPEEKQLSIDKLKSALSYYETMGLEKNAKELYMIYAQLIYLNNSLNQDSTKIYYDKLKTLLEFYQKPTVHIWYHNRYGYELIQKALEHKKDNERYFEEARGNILSALNILKTYNMQNNQSYPNCIAMLGEIDFYTEKFDSALRNYQKSYELYKNMGNLYYSTNMLKSISNLYQEIDDYKNAFQYQERYYEEQLKVETEKNDRSLRENELQQSVASQEKILSRKQSQQYILISILTVGILFIVLIYRNYKLKTISNSKLSEANHALNLKNKQNELLLKEIHHRVKNNLEMVKSLIALQSAKLEDNNAREAMLASQNRVQSMGIIHQKLYQGENLGSIEMKDYFINLSEGILDSFNAEEQVRIECAMENLELDVDTAVPIGLIVNELLTNALKYAFPENGKGKIQISLSKSSDEILTLSVADNGVGKKAELVPKGTGFGSQLVQLLTQQLNGTMKEEQDNGTKLQFDFKTRKAA